MPGLDGIETARQLIKLHEGRNRPRLIALTADNSNNEKQCAFEAGMDEFLLKPVKLEKLRETLVEQMKIANQQKSGQ